MSVGTITEAYESNRRIYYERKSQNGKDKKCLSQSGFCILSGTNNLAVQERRLHCGHNADEIPHVFGQIQVFPVT